MSASSGSTDMRAIARPVANVSPSANLPLAWFRSRSVVRTSDSGVLDRPDTDKGTSTQRCPWTLSGDGCGYMWGRWWPS